MSDDNTDIIKSTLTLDQLVDQKNICDLLSEEEIIALGNELHRGLEMDIGSLADWRKQNLGWIKLATQVVERKDTPWENASNVKVPILSVAALNFQARAFPALVPQENVVKALVIGKDSDNTKAQKAKRVSRFMDYQVLHGITNWYEDMDKALFILPYSGTVFKKVYFDPTENRACIDMVLPQDLIVNYYATSLAKAGRISHRMSMTHNEIETYMRMGLWRDVDLDKPRNDEKPNTTTKISRSSPPPVADGTTTYNVYEIMCWIDLDKDGYEEPYIVTIEYENKTVFRIKARYQLEDESITWADESKSKVAKITPNEYYTNYIMIPATDSGIYGLGWGALVGPVNESVNTLINQLIDAGTLAVMPAGLIAHNLKVLGGNYKFKPGEWKLAQFIGENMRNSFVELPVKEPSSTLYNLMVFLVGYAEKLGSAMEIMTGALPGQNTKSTVAMQALEQGMKVMNSIHKRLYRALNKELALLYKVNSRHLPVESYFTILDEKEGNQGTVLRDDFDHSSHDILPAADVNMTSLQAQLMKAQGLLEVSQITRLNMDEVARRILEAQEQPNVEALLDVPEQGPPLEVQLKQMEIESAERIKQADVQFKYDEMIAGMEKTQAEIIKIEAEAILAFAKAEAEGSKMDVTRMQMALDHIHNLNDSIQKRAELLHKGKELEAKKQEIKQKTQEKRATSE